MFLSWRLHIRAAAGDARVVTAGKNDLIQLLIRTQLEVVDHRRTAPLRNAVEGDRRSILGTSALEA